MSYVTVKPRRYVRAARTRGTPWFTWVCTHRDCQYGDRIGLPVTPSGVVGEEWHPTLGHAVEAGRKHFITVHAIPAQRREMRGGECAPDRPWRELA